MMKTIQFQNFSLTLDPDEIVEGDPGAGTPAIVSTPGYSATYWAATGWC